jgi:hypothetical protein
MKRVNYVVWGLLLPFGAFIVHESLDHNYYGSDFGPGPGFFSFWLGILLMVMSFVQIVMTYRRPADPLPVGFVPNREGIKRMLYVMGALVQPDNPDILHLLAAYTGSASVVVAHVDPRRRGQLRHVLPVQAFASDSAERIPRHYLREGSAWRQFSI